MKTIKNTFTVTMEISDEFLTQIITNPKIKELSFQDFCDAVRRNTTNEKLELVFNKKIGELLQEKFDDIKKMLEEKE